MCFRQVVIVAAALSLGTVAAIGQHMELKLTGPTPLFRYEASVADPRSTGEELKLELLLSDKSEVFEMSVVSATGRRRCEPVGPNGRWICIGGSPVGPGPMLSPLIVDFEVPALGAAAAVGQPALSMSIRQLDEAGPGPAATYQLVPPG